MSKRQVRGFTLIELLVVVAIIALLIAILLPSLGRAKANAVRVKCAAQLKQWGMVVNMYAQENNSWFGDEWQDAGTDPATGKQDKHYWSGIASGIPDFYDPEWGAIDTSVNGTGMSKWQVIMRTCPGDPLFGQYAAAGAQGAAVAKGTAGSGRPPVDYVVVRYTPVQSGVLAWRLSTFTHPGTTVLMLDSPTVQYGVGNTTMNSYYAFNTVGVGPPVGDLDSEPGQTLSQALSQRHLDIGNVAFLDGHVEQHKYGDFVANIPSAASDPLNAGKLWTTIAP